MIRDSIMAKKPTGAGAGAGGSSSCALCECSNLASICAPCVNYRLNNYYMTMRLINSRRDPLHHRLSNVLEAKKRADDKNNWRLSQKENLKKLRDRLAFLKKQLSEEKATIHDMSTDLKLRYSSLNAASATMQKNRVEILEKLNKNVIYTNGLARIAITSELFHKHSIIIKQICRLFPMCRITKGDNKDGFNCPYDQICSARLPIGLDPHSVPSVELSASLGYMVHLLNLIVPTLAAPALHNSGFAGSCSHIWQRDSYWNAQPSSPSKEYPLFIQPRKLCSSGGENSWSDKSSLNFGVSSLESDRKSFLDASGSGSFNHSSSSPHSVETHKELQKGISLLKKSVTCIAAYCYNMLGLELPLEDSTFEAFAKLLTILASSRQLQSTRSSTKMTGSRSDKRSQQLNQSVWNVNWGVSSSSLLESTHTTAIPSADDNKLANSVSSFVYSAEMPELGISESLVDGWDIVDHHPFPPPPSQVEDFEHWTRAMFIDATKK